MHILLIDYIIGIIAGYIICKISNSLNLLIRENNIMKAFNFVTNREYAGSNAALVGNGKYPAFASFRQLAEWATV